MRVLVKDVMSKGVLKLRKHQTIGEVNQLFLARVIDGAPVVDDSGKVMGIFTKTHLMRAMGKPLDMPIEMLMNRNVITISELMPVEEAMNIPVGRLPVVNTEGLMVGWLTRTDLASAFVNHYKKSIDSFWQIFNTTCHGIISVNRLGEIEMMNKMAEQVLEQELQSIEGENGQALFPFLKFDEAMISQKKLEYTAVYLDKKINIRISPLSQEGQNGAMAELFSIDV